MTAVDKYIAAMADEFDEILDEAVKATRAGGDSAEYDIVKSSQTPWVRTVGLTPARASSLVSDLAEADGPFVGHYVPVTAERALVVVTIDEGGV